jgi:predicted nucleotidyltransferase component of viral defense system
MHIETIKKLLAEQAQCSNVFKRNFVKEYVQIMLLSHVYSSREYQQLIFYGGSCLRHCFGLERLSEDLDFVDQDAIELKKMSADMRLFLEREFGVKVSMKTQRFRIYLKLPILKELGIAGAGESDLLHLKVEVYNKFQQVPSCQIQIVPVFRFGKSMLLKTFDLPTLMSTKISAVLHRKWERTSKSGMAICTVKGRDYYDLMWYLRKGVRPNLEYLGIETMKVLKARLLENVNKLDERSIRADLEGFIPDAAFVDNLSKNIRQMLVNQIDQL